MSNKNLIIVIVLIVVGLGLLAGGYFGGILYQQEKNKPELEKLERLEKAEKTVKAVSSKVVASVVAFGEVTKISNKTITLTYGGESLEIRVKEDAQIYSFEALTPPKQGITAMPEQKKAEFSDIKVGSQVNAIIKILQDGQIEGLSVIIFPSFKKESQ